MKFVNKEYINNYFKDKRVAIIGSAPTALDNLGDYINNFDKVVRVNNYKIFPEQTGVRTDVHYAFYGSSIRKTAEELKKDGVELCMCKCPDAEVHVTEWHKTKGGMTGCDFRKIYRRRNDFWFCDTYIPTEEQYMNYFNLLGGHVPTTGFAGILELIGCKPKELYITGFTFMKCNTCGNRGWDCKCNIPNVKHNINELWRRKNPEDPIRHVPEKEYEILMLLAKENDFIKLDRSLSE